MSSSLPARLPIRTVAWYKASAGIRPEFVVAVSGATITPLAGEEL
jgi:hypothetical protein